MTVDLLTVEAMAAYLPATLVLIGLGAAAVGFLPRRATWAWAVLAVAFVVEMFGPLLDLPAWAMRISPFQSVPQLPADPFELLPVVALTAAGAALIAASALRYRHRDLPA